MLAPLIQSSEPGLEFHFAPSHVHQDDLDVGDILSDIGFFSNDTELDTTDMQQDSYLLPNSGTESHSTSAIASAGLDTSNYVAAPVSPDHTSNIQPIRSSGPLTTVAASAVTPSCSVENLTTFSVPNPMAAIMALESSSDPVSPQLPPIAAAPMPPPVATKLPARKAPKKKAASVKKTTKVTKRKLSTGSSAKVSVSVRGSSSSTTKSARSKAAVTTSSNAAILSASKFGGILGNNDDHLTEEQMEERRQRNREHAKRSRLRKKSLTATLQQSVDELKAENAKLRSLLNARMGAARTEATLEARRVQSRNKFIENLRATSRGAVDDASLSFLKSLRKNAQKQTPSTSS